MNGRLAGTVVLMMFGVVDLPAADAQNMNVTSTEISDGSLAKNEQVANVFGCKGGNVSPSLTWNGAPSNAKSFAITLYDPDAPTGSGFWHWIAIGIPASTTSIPKDAGNVKKALMPRGTVQIRNDFGFEGYGGPCPPHGDKPHHYILTVYAVDVAETAGVDKTASPAAIAAYLRQHEKSHGTLRWTYGR